MRNIRRHENALEGAITGIAKAVMAVSRGFGEGIPDEGCMRVQYDDSIIQDTADDILCVTFARGKDELGRTAYRFIGVFRHDGPKEDDPWTGVDVRVADEIDLSPWN